MGLLTALLLQSCRSLQTLGKSEDFARMYTAYKHEYIRATNNSLSHETTRISDITISMVMVLVAESVSDRMPPPTLLFSSTVAHLVANHQYVLGDCQEWEIHLRAFTDMIRMRGGLDSLGLDGFLQQVIVKYVRTFSGKFGIC